MKTLLIKLSAIIFSIFSIIFSLSIVKELSKTVEGYVFIFLAIFIVAFLITNETFKVRELARRFQKRRSSLFLIIFTFIISFSLSSMGIYFWTNKTQELSNQIAEDRQVETLDINNTYRSLIDSAASLLVTSLPEYNKVGKDISYLKWKYYSDTTLTETGRPEMMSSIISLQSKQTEIADKHSLQVDEKIGRLEEEKQIHLSGIDAKFNTTTTTKDKNNTISIIFLCMVAITEFMIVIIQRELARATSDNFQNSAQYKRELAIIEELYDLDKVDEKVGINDIKYSVYARAHGIEWDTIKQIYNLYMYVSIIRNGYLQKNGDKILTGYYKQMEEINQN